MFWLSFCPSARKELRWWWPLGGPPRAAEARTFPSASFTVGWTGKPRLRACDHAWQGQRALAGSMGLLAPAGGAERMFVNRAAEARAQRSERAKRMVEQRRGGLAAR